MNKVFNIVEQEEQFVVEIYGEIGDSWWNEGVTLKSVSEQLKQLTEKKKKCLVRINSLGGDVNEALAIYDLLRTMDDITTECSGMCASAATIIAMAGKVRHMSRYGLFLVHKCWSATVGNENQLEAELETQRAINDRIAQLYADVTGTEKEKIEELMNENNGDGRWITSDEAMKYGFMTEEMKSEPANMSAAFIFRTMRNLFNTKPNLFNPKSNEEMKQEEFDAFKAQAEQEKAALEKQLAESVNAKAALESEKKELQDKVSAMEEAAKAAEESHAKQVEELNGKIAELQAIVDKVPAATANANAPDPKEKSFEDWYAGLGYVQDAKKELGR